MLNTCPYLCHIFFNVLGLLPSPTCACSCMFWCFFGILMGFIFTSLCQSFWGCYLFKLCFVILCNQALVSSGILSFSSYALFRVLATSVHFTSGSFWLQVPPDFQVFFLIYCIGRLKFVVANLHVSWVRFSAFSGLFSFVWAHQFWDCPVYL